MADGGWRGPAERAAFHRSIEGDRAADPGMERFSQLEGKVITRARPDLVSDESWYGSRHFEECRRPARVDHSIYSSHALATPGWAICIGLYRGLGDGPFPPSAVQLVNVFQTAMGGFYRERLPGAGGGLAASLAPRLQGVLHYLLQGDQEKEVAAKLGRSQHTVHQYIKLLHKHFAVSSRAELLSLCLGGSSHEEPPSGPLSPHTPGSAAGAVIPPATALHAATTRAE